MPKIKKSYKLEDKHNNQKMLDESKCSKSTEISYYDNENEHLIQIYGNDTYEHSKETEMHTCMPNLLINHNIESKIRTRMIDWMFEVLYAYNSEENTVFIAEYILDTFIHKYSKQLGSSDIHLIGICAMFLASKMEDISPLNMVVVADKIGHNKFSSNAIHKMEMLILETIGFELIITTPYDFVKTYMYDFLFNNRGFISKINFSEEIIKQFENTTLFLCKMIMHDEAFCSYKYSLRAIACLVAAFDIIRSNMEIPIEGENFIKEWLKFIIHESNYNNNEVCKLYSSIVEYYSGFGELTIISHNLRKNHLLNF